MRAWRWRHVAGQALRCGSRARQRDNVCASHSIKCQQSGRRAACACRRRLGSSRLVCTSNESQRRANRLARLAGIMSRAVCPRNMRLFALSRHVLARRSGRRRPHRQTLRRDRHHSSSAAVPSGSFVGKNPQPPLKSMSLRLIRFASRRAPWLWRNRILNALDFPIFHRSRIAHCVLGGRRET